MPSVVPPRGILRPADIERCSNLIERVTLALRELSSGSPGDTEAPDWVERRIRLQCAGADFADAYRLLTDCPQLHVTAGQAESLEQLYEALFELEGLQDVSRDGNDSGSEAALWNGIRRLAANTLTELGDNVYSHNPEDVRIVQTDPTRGS
jgi:hypothetical protein